MVRTTVHSSFWNEEDSIAMVAELVRRGCRSGYPVQTVVIHPDCLTLPLLGEQVGTLDKIRL